MTMKPVSLAIALTLTCNLRAQNINNVRSFKIDIGQDGSGTYDASMSVTINPVVGLLSGLLGDPVGMNDCRFMNDESFPPEWKAKQSKRKTDNVCIGEVTMTFRDLDMLNEQLKIAGIVSVSKGADGSIAVSTTNKPTPRDIHSTAISIRVPKFVSFHGPDNIVKSIPGEQNSVLLYITGHIPEARVLGRLGNSPIMIDPVFIEPGVLTTRILTTPEELTKHGRKVVGVAADGVARIVIRLPGASSTSPLKLSLCSDKKDTACGNLNPNEYGLLAPLGDLQKDLTKLAAPTLTSITLRPPVVTSQAVLPTNASAASPQSTAADIFAVYRAPMDFVRRSINSAAATPLCPRGYEAEDCAGKYRTVYLRVGDSDTDQWLPIQIHLPPAIFIHGYNSESASWAEFISALGISQPHLLTNYGRRLYTAKYDLRTNEWKPIRLTPVSVDLQSAKPEALPPSALFFIMDSHFGLSYNAPNVANQISSAVNVYSGRQTHAQDGVAMAQVDVVAHSMGGLIARWIIKHDIDARMPDLFGMSRVHKMITLGTPHLWFSTGPSAVASGCALL